MKQYTDAELEHMLDDSENLNWQVVMGISDEELPAISLQGARYREGLNQQQLAEKTGISKRHISEMENGKRPIDEDTAIKLGKVLNVDIHLIETKMRSAQGESNA